VDQHVSHHWSQFIRRKDRRKLLPQGLPPMGAENVAIERRRKSRRETTLGELIPLFRGVTDALIYSALNSCLVAEYNKRTILLQPGQVNRHIYILLSGGMTAEIGSADAPHAIRFRPGESVGEMSIADGSAVSAQVTAEPGSRILTIDAQTFWSKVIVLQPVARNILTIQAERQRRSNTEIIEKVRAEMLYAQIKQDLAMAAEIQLNMLPRNFPLYPDYTEFDVYASMVPAKDVGGDFYDAFMIDREHLFFVIGDVSGRGVAAALFMVKAMTLLRTEASHKLPPHEVLHRVNGQLALNNDRCMFVTVICGILEIGTGKVQYSNAGHTEPLIGGPGGFRQIDIPFGTAVGLIEDCSYTTAEIRLWPGEMLLLYTDGVTDAVDGGNCQFSEPRLLAELTRIGAANANQTVSRLCDAIDAFTRGVQQFDDITILAIKYRSKSASVTPWDERWNLGVFELDLQHRHLLDLLNQLADLLQTDVDGDLPDRLMNDFMQYYKLHTASEERHMLTSGNDGFAQHRKAHSKFDASLARLVAEPLLSSGREHGTRLVDELRRLWIHHVEHQDAGLRK
jgi:hemerythrin-like metal-binding protein